MSLVVESFLSYGWPNNLHFTNQASLMHLANEIHV